MIRRLLDWLLGPRCPQCGDHVPTVDRERHLYLEHAGDRP